LATSPLCTANRYFFSSSERDFADFRSLPIRFMSVLLLLLLPRGYNDADQYAAIIVIILKYYEQLLRRPRFWKARTSSDRDVPETLDSGAEKAIGEREKRSGWTPETINTATVELLGGGFTLWSHSNPLKETVVPAHCRKPIAPSSLHSRSCAIAAG